MARLGCADSASPSQGETRVLGLVLLSLLAGLLLAPPLLDLNVARMHASRNQGEEVGVAPPTTATTNSLEEPFAFLSSDLTLKGESQCPREEWVNQETLSWFHSLEAKATHWLLGPLMLLNQ